MPEVIVGLWFLFWALLGGLGWAMVDVPRAIRRQWALACGILALTGVVVYLLSCPL